MSGFQHNGNDLNPTTSLGPSVSPLPVGDLTPASGSDTGKTPGTDTLEAGVLPSGAAAPGTGAPPSGAAASGAGAPPSGAAVPGASAPPSGAAAPPLGATAPGTDAPPSGAPGASTPVPTGEVQETIFEVKKQLNAKEVKMAGKVSVRNIILDKVKENKELREQLISMDLCSPLDPALKGINVPVANYLTYTPYHDYTLEELIPMSISRLRDFLFSVQANTSSLLDGAKAICSSEYAFIDGKFVRVADTCGNDVFSKEELETQQKYADQENLHFSATEENLGTFIGKLPKKKSELNNMGKSRIVDYSWGLIEKLKELTAIILQQNQTRAIELAQQFDQKSEKGQYVIGETGDASTVQDSDNGQKDTDSGKDRKDSGTDQNGKDKKDSGTDPHGKDKRILVPTRMGRTKRIPVPTRMGRTKRIPVPTKMGRTKRIPVPTKMGRTKRILAR
ncbi:MAG: hypothetical protein IIY58_01090 [Aeriscardovia sp.]|nr:hypothetical protein [Aeriscardovia sp.]